MIKAAPFNPFLGKEKEIEQKAKVPGWLYFASDTGNMFLDISSQERIAVGGGGSTFYYSNTVIPQGYETWKLSYDELENKENKPRANDLLINSGGELLRVLRTDTETIYTSIISISGTGGGSSAGYSLKFAYNDLKNKFFAKNETEAKISFTITQFPVQEGNKISSLSIYLLDEKLGAVEIARDETEREFGKAIDLNISKYFSKFTSDVNTIYISVTDYANNIFNFPTQTYTINLVNLKISSSMQEILVVEDDNNLSVECATIGQSNLSKITIHYDVCQEDGTFMFSKTQSQNSPGKAPIIYLNFDAASGYADFHGVCNLNIYATIDIEDNDNVYQIPSDIITYKIIHYYTGGSKTPILCVLYPKNNIVEQYNYYDIKYRIYNGSENAIEDYKIELEEKLYKLPLANPITSKSLTVNTIDMHTRSTYFDTQGEYRISLGVPHGMLAESSVISVVEYTGEMPVINTELDSLALNLSANNRNDNETNKDVWKWKDIEVEFNDSVRWGESDGWRMDEDQIGYLHLTSGAGFSIPTFRPFETDVASATANGCTIELDFKFSNITDYKKPLIFCKSMNGEKVQVGFQLTADTGTLDSYKLTVTDAKIEEVEDEDNEAEQEKIIVNTAIQGRTARLIADERIHLTWVIEPIGKDNLEYPMVKTYINGILSGITKQLVGDSYVETSSYPAIITVDSTYADIDIYNIRVYKEHFLDNTILNNYIATAGSNQDRTNSYLENKIIQYNVEKERDEIYLPLIENGVYQMKVPYIKLTGGAQIKKNDAGKYYLTDGDISQARLPRTKKDYRLMKFDFIDPTGVHKNFVEDIVVTSGEKKTSTVTPDQANWIVNSGSIVYGQGTSSMEYAVKNLRIKFKSQDVEVYDGAYPVDLICLKADYMESSGTHNTTTANLVYDLYSNLHLESPAQKFYHSDVYDGEEVKDLVTAIRGFPVVIFYSATGEEGTYKYIGKYNFNLDKATPEPFGFFNHPKADINYANQPKEKQELIKEYLDNGKAFGWEYDKSNNITSTIHCFEFKNNNTNLCKFNVTGNNTFEEEWKTLAESFESRYPDEGDLLDDYAITLGKTDADELTSAEKFACLEANAKSWKRVVEWVYNTRNDLEKFKAEFEEYFDLEFTKFYYILTHVFLMIDSRAKNMMMATWDNIHWFPILYDMDTMLGLNNFGYNKFYYSIEDTDPGIYNAEGSFFWDNFRRAYATPTEQDKEPEVYKYYNKMKEAGFNVGSVLDRYNLTHADLLNETFFNEDSYYKFQRIFSEGFYRVKDGKEEWVGPGKDDRLYASQGRRSMHRQWWLTNRFNLFDSHYRSGDYLEASNTINLRFFNASGAGSEIPEKWEFNITPIQDAYVAVKIGNSEFYSDQIVPANTSYFIDASGTSPTETETYIGGPSYIKDLGDLSLMYPSQFTLNATSPLTRLILGNEMKGYYNTQLGTINTTSTPFLEELNISNSRISGAIDCSSNKRIKKILACGTTITDVALPSYSQIEELRLPATTNTLILNNCKELTNEKFTIGTIQYNLINEEENLYEKTYINDFSSLTQINIVNTPIDSYLILKGIPEEAGGNKIELTYGVIGFNWEITDINDIAINNNSYSIKVLERLLRSKVYSAYNNKHEAALKGHIHFNIANLETPFEAQAIYNAYWNKYPEVTFSYDENMNVNPSYKITLKDATGAVIWRHQVANNSMITAELFNTGPMGAYQSPDSYPDYENGYTYTFTNEWYVNSSDENAPIYTTAQMMTNNNQPITSDLEFYAKYEASELTSEIHFYDENGEEYEGTSYTTKWKSYLVEPNIYPYKPYIGDTIEERWGFKGFKANLTDTIATDITTIQATKERYDFYAHFELENVYETITPQRFFNGKIVQQNNIDEVWLKPKEGIVLQGKITIPKQIEINETMYDVNAIYGFNQYDEDGDPKLQPQQITHIFFESGHNLTTIQSHCFKSLKSLVYINCPSSLQIINNEAFRDCELIGINLSHTKLTTLGKQCFMGGFLEDIAATAEVYLPASWTVNNGQCFRQLMSNLYVQIGQENKDYIKNADLVKNNATSWRKMFHSNVVTGEKINLQLTFYIDATLENQFSIFNDEEILWGSSTDGIIEGDADKVWDNVQIDIVAN